MLRRARVHQEAPPSGSVGTDTEGGLVDVDHGASTTGDYQTFEDQQPR